VLRPKTILVYEYDSLRVNEVYKDVEFSCCHFKHLAEYITINPKPQLFSLFHNSVRFLNYVGVIKVGDLTIEVLPKTDRHADDKDMWQSVLFEMLAISLQVEAKTTNNVEIQIKRHSVLETYVQLFIDDVKTLVHHGLIKKYRQNVSNQTALKGKFHIHQHISKNLMHAERFYVKHTVYDRDNIYNSILEETLRCIKTLNISDSISQSADLLLIDFPECKPSKISESVFQRLTFDRKTERYKTAIQLARIILLNYHPDVKSGTNNVLAIMFDMNRLWENYVYWILKKSSSNSGYEVTIKSQQKTLFWQHPDEWNLQLKPDLLVDITKDGITKSFVLDTKWKYRSDTSMEDARQMFAYSKYFSRKTTYLLYPNTLIQAVSLKQGYFYSPGLDTISDTICGTGFLNIIVERKLHQYLGYALIDELFSG
jgi:5-methylcytosine-specific restriction enzyme subunit McrC